MSRPLPPGSTVGVFGGGQLGRMLALAAAPMGYRVHVFAPATGGPAGQVAHLETRGDYLDADAVAGFARSVDVVTFEFENIPLAAAETAERFCPVRPHGSILHATQNRAREKRALAAAGLPVVAHEVVESRDELAAAARRVGLPGVLKTTQWGYDGKGQTRVESEADLAGAWEEIGGGPAVLEKLVCFEREVSVVGARGLDGRTALFDLAANAHEDHVLDVSVVPAPVPREVHDRAAELGRAVLEAFDVVGVLCVEMFLLPGGELVVNELAPRPHNSGHWSIDGAVASQFEQQLRAVCGLPLGDPSLRAPGVAMANLLGRHLPPRAGEATGGEGAAGAWSELLAEPGLHLHLYGKDEPRPARKMGHLTTTGDAGEEAEARVRRARSRLTARGGS